MTISVIIPVYNGEKWVAQCIENMLCQSYKELEIIVIDDGSTDATAEIAARYPVRLFRQENRGLSATRNRGIEEATGDYIHFMDVDDWINLDYYAAMAEAVALTDADMAFGGFVHEPAPYYTHLFRDRLLLMAPGGKFGVTIVGQLPSSCRYIVRKRFLDERTLRFQEGRYFEDLPFTMEAVCEAHKIVTVPGATYYYKRSEGSIMRTRNEKTTLKKREDVKWTRQVTDELMRRYALPDAYYHLLDAKIFQYKILGIPMLEKRVTHNGKERWYLFGVRVCQKKQKI